MVFINEENRFYNFFNMELTTEKKLKNDNVINILKDAINKKRIISFEYELNGNIKYQKEIKPYKILFMNDNYYLTAEVNNDYKYSMFRINNISNVNIENYEFEFDYDLLDFIINIQTPFAKYQENYKEHLIKIIVEVNKSKTKFFETKKFLPSQEIIDKLDNGNYIISFEVTQELEIEDIVKKWIPHIKIIEPLTLKDKIVKDLKIYLENQLD
jgi:predicted DNA-binding transcriptional regulator YafY